MSDTGTPASHCTNRKYLEPLIVAPAQEHKQTFIVLHGRGSITSKFAPPLLAAPISDSQTLREAFPHAKFIFPTAPKRRAVIYNRSFTHQWFDCWHLYRPEEHEDLQYDGLRETSAYLHALLVQEIELVGPRNVVLWGLSMGCAAALVVALTWQGEPIGAVVGMCGWLPFRRRLEEALRGGWTDDVIGGGEEDIFEADPEVDAELDRVMKTVEWLREELNMPRGQTTTAFQRIPVFLGHGVEDNKVPVDIGCEAAGCLKALGVSAHWKEYGGLAHWYSRHMLSDIKEFL
jgi:predicted esterase